jgi:hypothetical protein
MMHADFQSIPAIDQKIHRQRPTDKFLRRVESIKTRHAFTTSTTGEA